VLLLGGVARRVLPFAAFERADRLHDRVVIARERQRRHRRQRIHDGQQVVGPDVLADEPDQRIAHGHGAAARDVVIVEQNREDAHVLALGVEELVVARAELAGRQVVAPGAGGVDQLELIDDLRPAVLEHLEIVLRQAGHGIALAIRDDDVDADEIDAGAKDGLRGCLRRCGRVLRGGDDDGDQGDERGGRTHPADGPERCLAPTNRGAASTRRRHDYFISAVPRLRGSWP
jgi:hypothetical protein